MCICFGREQCGVCAEPFPKEIHEYKQLPTAGVSYRMSEGHGILAETTCSVAATFPRPATLVVYEGERHILNGRVN